ncbi:MAG: hypothetical protein KJ831_02955 [Candidatus Eisenbacteria bacterium]|nr:hypothetical protein [Candidatus Eisenbacteria bacterium]
MSLNRTLILKAAILVLVLGMCLSPAPYGPLAQDEPEQNLITLDADSTSVVDILQILASRTGLNIVTSPELQGRRISIHLKDTPFDEALNLVVRAAGLGYERVGKSILVADVQRLNTETGLVTKTFHLKYANAADVSRMLELLTKAVTSNVQGNKIVMRASPSVIEQAESIIAGLDEKPSQILLEARLFEVNTTGLLEIGIDWEKITNWTTVVAEGSYEGSAAGQIPPRIPFTPFEKNGDIQRQMAAFEVTIEALVTEGRARLLSNAKVVTLDNEPAEIFAGETVPVVITSLQSPTAAGGVLQTIQLEKIDVGVKLGITPRISGNGYITTLVEPEVSRIVAFIGPDDDLPQTSTRRTRTYVRVRDGGKIYIGGLLAEEERNSVKKVPLLGDIPFLGYFFQHRKTEKSQLDLIIEITPRIVSDEGVDDASARPIPETLNDPQTDDEG